MSDKLDDGSIHENCNSNCGSCTHNLNPLLAGVGLAERQHLDNSRNEIKYKRGELIYKENAFPAGLFCLNNGKVMLTKSDKNGNRIVTSFHKGVSFIGISDYLSDTAYRSSCVALTDVKVCMIKSSVVEDLINNNTNFARRLLRNVENDNHQCNARILALTKKNMNARLADTLLELIGVFGLDEDRNLNVYLRRSEIAMMCNMTENNVIRHLSELNKQHIIKLKSKRIEILDQSLLLKESNAIF